MLRITPTPRISRSLIASTVITGLVAAPALFAPPPAQAVAPGYNGTIAFQMPNPDHGTLDIYVVNTDETGLTNLTNEPANDAQAYWSPDGTKLVFHSNRDGDNEIYIMNADGSGLQQLTDNTASDAIPAWSPDGSKIAFASDRDGGPNEIYVMNVDGSSQTRLTNDSPIDTAPNWSPDGTQIAWRHGQGPSDSEREVYVMDADGANQLNLTNNSVTDENPAYSPDGTKIVFMTRRDGDKEIYVMDADGANPVRLTNGTMWDGSPVWSPDGTKIVFDDHTDGGLYQMNPDGSGVEAIFLGAGAKEPSWQPIPNQAPVAASDTLTVSYNTATEKAVLANDTDEEELSGSNLSITVQPTHGAASVNTSTGTVTYTPTNGYTGSDSLTYQICDSFTLDQQCATAVLGITVQAAAPDTTAPAVPVLTGLGTVQAVPGATSYFYTGHRPTFAGSAEPGATINVLIESVPITLTTIADADGTWSVTPDTDIPNGDHTVTITATDTSGNVSPAFTFTLGINTGLAATGWPLWPLSVVGLIGVVAARWLLSRRYAGA